MSSRKSSRRGQAKQLACRSHQTHLSFFTAVEFYRQRKLPDIPRKSPSQTGLEWVAERSRRTSCIGLAVFAPLFSFCFRHCRSPCGRRPTKINPSPLFMDHSIRELAPNGLAAHLISHRRLIYLTTRSSSDQAGRRQKTPTVNKTGILLSSIKNSNIPLFLFLLA